jgi:hypothetical protein
MGPFAHAYFGEPVAADGRSSGNLLEALTCFRTLFRELRAWDGR